MQCSQPIAHRTHATRGGAASPRTGDTWVCYMETLNHHLGGCWHMWQFVANIWITISHVWQNCCMECVYIYIYVYISRFQFFETDIICCHCFMEYLYFVEMQFLLCLGRSATWKMTVPVVGSFRVFQEKWALTIFDSYIAVRSVCFLYRTSNHMNCRLGRLCPLTGCGSGLGFDGFHNPDNETGPIRASRELKSRNLNQQASKMLSNS